MGWQKKCRALIVAVVLVLLVTSVLGLFRETPLVLANPDPPSYQGFAEGKSSGGTSVTVNKPSGTTAGDLLVAVYTTDGEETHSAPDGGYPWTGSQRVARTGDAQATVSVWYRTAVAGEPANYTFSTGTYEQHYIAILRITGHDPTSPINAWGVADGESSSPQCPSITTTVNDTLILRVFGADDDDITVDGGYPSGHTGITVDKSTSGNGTCAGGVAYKTQASASATGTASFSLTASEEWATYTIAIAPAPPLVAPTVTNASGATDITSYSARLNGYLAEGIPDPAVHIYWGDEDGGTTAVNWDHDENLGTMSAGNFYRDISSLNPDTTYYYRCYATNSQGSDWADSTEQFTTPPLPVRTAWLSGTTLENNSTDLNVSTAGALKFTSQTYDNTYFSYAGGNPTRLTVDRDGDYLFCITVPQHRGDANDSRTRIEASIYKNGIIQDVGEGKSSYIRNLSSHSESSSHLNVLLENLSAFDYIEVKVRGITTVDSGDDVLVSGQFSLYAEYISDRETVFSGTATQTTNSTNLNQSTAYEMKWTESRKNTGYTHSDVSSPEDVILDSTGNYLVMVNIPLYSTAVRANVRGKILIAGVQVNGGEFKQGYIRSTESDYYSSIHWVGVVTTTSSSQALSVSVEQEANTGTVTVGGEKATIFVQKLPSKNIYYGRGTDLTGGTNWNPASADTVKWVNDAIKDTTVYEHSTSVNPHQVKVLKDGDYLLAFNGAFSSAVVRSNNRITVAVNGTEKTGANTGTNYIRYTNSHDEASASLVYFLKGLSANDIITVNTQQEAAAGIVNDSVDAILFIWKKEPCWESYNDASRTIMDNNFSTGENTVYMFGEGFEASTAYHVAYYDGDGDKMLSDGVNSNASGELSSQCYFPTYQDVAVVGTWHSVVYKDSVASPPESYVAGDPNSVVEDSFEVTIAAIPEIPSAGATVVVCAVCFVIYRRMKGRK